MSRFTPALRALAVSALLFAGCKDDGGSNATDSGTPDGGDTDAGTGGPLWVATGWTLSGEDYSGFLAVVSDLTSGQINLANVVDLGTDYSFGSDENGNVFVGRDDMPVIQKWSLDANGVLSLSGTLNLSTLGVTSAMGGNRNVIQIISPTRAYYFDNEALRVVIFNPTTMLLTGTTIDLSSLGSGANVGSSSLNFIERVNDNFYVSTRLWDNTVDEWAIQELRVAIVSATTGAVTYTTDTRCGDMGFTAQDEDGNVYFGSHHALAAWGGDPADSTPPEPCMLRILAGQTTFDASYHVDLNDLVDGYGAGLFPGPDGHAFITKYESAEPIASAWRTMAVWRVYSIELGNEAATLTQVPDLPLVMRYVGTFDTQIGAETVPFLITETASGGSYTNLSDLTDPSAALTVSGGSLGRAAVLRR